MCVYMCVCIPVWAYMHTRTPMCQEAESENWRAIGTQARNSHVAVVELHDFVFQRILLRYVLIFC